VSSNSTKKLLEEVSEILWVSWDPIGVNDGYKKDDSECGWSDEYDSYAPFITKLLIQRADEYKISQHLSQIAETNMGLQPTKEHDLRVARILKKHMELRESSYARKN